MPYHIDENKGDIRYEVEGERLVLKIKPESIPAGGAGGSGIYVIKENDETNPSDRNVYSALRSEKEFLHKNRSDTASGHIHFEKGITVEETAYLRDLVVKHLAEILQLNVTDVATLARAIVETYVSSGIFIPGFDGEGFKIWQLASGDWNIEIDTATIRKTLTVFELLIQKIRAIKGALAVTQANGKVKGITESEMYYSLVIEDENSFMPGDLVRCQTWRQTGSRYYWARVEESEGNEIRILKSEFSTTFPEAGDELVQMGNDTDVNRQSMIYISAAGDGHPIIDVLNGINSKSLAGKMLVRIGCLDDITDVDFPLNHQPSGYGIYCANGFFKGVFILSTGVDIETKFMILENLINSEISSLRDEIQQKDNYLFNSAFATDTKGWTANTEIRFFTVNGKLLYFNENFYTEKKHIASIVKFNTKNVLYIRNSGIKQLNGNLSKRPDVELDEEGLPQLCTFYASFRGRVVKAGKLTIGFAGQELYHEVPLMETDDFSVLEYAGTWDGTGDFVLNFTGEIYLYSLGLSDDTLSNLAERLTSKIEQTEAYIDAYVGVVNGRLEKQEADFRITAQQVSSIIKNFDSEGNLLNSAGWITTGEANTLYATKNGDEIISYINQAPGNTVISSAKINLIGAVTFNAFDSGLQNRINGKVDASALGGLAYKNMVEKEQLGSTIIVGGYIKTGLIDVDNLYCTSLAAVRGDIAGFTIRGKILENNTGDSIISIGNNNTGRYTRISASGSCSNIESSVASSTLACASFSALDDGIALSLRGCISGFALKVGTVGANETIELGLSYVFAGGSPIYLPGKTVVTGTCVFVKNRSYKSIHIVGGFHKIYTNTVVDSVDLNSAGEVFMFVYDGAYWNYAKFEL